MLGLEKEREEYSEDVLAIPSFLRGWEYIIIFVYVAIFLSLLVWYVSAYMLTSESQPGFLGLPKPISGAIIISMTWTATNFTLGTLYHLYVRKRIKDLRNARRGSQP